MSVLVRSSAEVFRSLPWYTFTVREPSLVKRAISVCHCLMATVGSTINVPHRTIGSMLWLEDEEDELLVLLSARAGAM